MKLSALISDFLKSLKGNKSELTIKNYQYYLGTFHKFASDIHPANINVDLVNKYKAFLASKNLKGNSQNYFLIALRSFLRHLSKKGINALSFDSIGLKKFHRNPVNILDESYLRQLLEAANGQKIREVRNRAILETLFSKGLLVSDLVSLNRQNLDDLKLSASARFFLEKYLSLRKDTFKPLFIRFQGKVDSTDNGQSMRLTVRSIERIVQKYAKGLNLPKITPQTFRHYLNFNLPTS